MAKRPIKELDIEAREEFKTGATKKKFTVKDMNALSALTETQRELFIQWNEDKSMLVTGSAGTGKSLLCLWLGLRDVLDENSFYENLTIIRSIVPSREIGFTPGTVDEKIKIYESPYVSICNHIFPYAKSYENLKRGGYLTFESTSFLRGTTIDNSVIIVDELQNLSWHECNTVMTRVGNNSKIIFIGDDKQTDLTKKNDASGFKEFVNILNRMKSIERVVFTPNDVVRSGIVKEYLKILEGY